MATPRDLSGDLASLRITRERRSRPPRSRAWPVGAAVVAGLGVALYALAPSATRLLFPVRVAVTEVTSLTQAQADAKLTTTGYVVPQRHAVVAAKQPARVLRVAVVEGQDVAEGELLAELERHDLEASLAEAHAVVRAAGARLEGARASAAEAELFLSRERSLHASGATSKAALDAAEARHRLAGASMRAAAAEVASAASRVKTIEIAVSDTRVVAPFAGRVVRKLVEVGEAPAVGQGGGPGIVELADFKTLMVEADVSEGKIGAVKLGDPVELALDAFPGQRFRGQVAEVRPTVDRQKATVLVKVRFVDAAEGVLPQMAAKVVFLTKPLDEAARSRPPRTVVAATAVIERGGGKAVFVLRDGRARLASVVTGETLGTTVELLEGPPHGARVVNRPPGDLEDGAEVKEGGDE